jgi:F-type H+-transporting ATPase subunit epsilon
MTLQVALVVPEGEVWTGAATMVIAKTLEGNIGVYGGHSPVLGILVEGSIVRIRPEDSAEGEISAAVSSGFFSVAEDRVSILARQALLSSQIDAAGAQAALDSALAAAGPGGEETADVRYYRAQLQAVSVGS